MKGLQGARVLVLDDDADDALAMVKAFSKSGIPVAYFDGSPGGRPSKRERLCGVRLAILDMNLGITGSNENIASTLVQTFSEIISPKNGPYGILVWTNHPDLPDLVMRYIFARSELPRPVFVQVLRKSNFIRRSGTGEKKRVAMRALMRAIVEKASEQNPLRCFETWESLSFRAATNVTNRVAEMGGSTATSLADWAREWREDANRLILAMSKAHAEGWHDASNCISSLLLALNPLHADRVEVLVGDAGNILADQVPSIMSAGGGAKIERRGKVNSMLHLAVDQAQRWCAGNLYVFSSRSLPPSFPRLRDVIGMAVEGATVRELLEKSMLCGVEITPACDHAQKKVGFSKVLMGALIKSEDARKAKVKRAPFLKQMGPFYFERSGRVEEGTYDVILNSRYLGSASPRTMGTLRAVARIRPELLAEIQVWSAFQAARQGTLFVE